MLSVIVIWIRYSVANNWDQANSDDEDFNNEEEAQMAFMANLEVTNSTPTSDDEKWNWNILLTWSWW